MMDNFFEFDEAGRDKHQRFMQQASDQWRARKSVAVHEAAATAIQRLRPVLASLINLIAR